jgi:hypothetical protein
MTDETKAALLAVVERVARDSTTIGGHIFLHGTPSPRVVDVMDVLDCICDLGVSEGEIDAVVQRVQDEKAKPPKPNDPQTMKEVAELIHKSTKTEH